MANPKEKIFLLYIGMGDNESRTTLMKYIEDGIGKEYKNEPKRYMHWMRLSGARLYIIGTTEDTLWTVGGIINKIQKNVSGAHSIFCVEIQDRPAQGLMGDDFWKFYHNIQDLTGYIATNHRYTKLKKIKQLLAKKEKLKRKDEELKNREQELLRKKEILSEEEELLRKEEEIRKQEEELNKKEKEIIKKKKFLGIF